LSATRASGRCVTLKSLRVLTTLLIITVPCISACTYKPRSATPPQQINTPLLSNQSGGSFTISNRGQQSLQRPQPNLSAEQQLEWAVGKSFATQAWVSAPATTTARDGLGPLFNANSCTGCHVRNGQGQLPEHGPGLILRLENASSSYGEQLQDMAIPGVQPEGRIRWQTGSTHTAIAGGEPVQLHQRDYHIDSAPQLATSARLAPALIGMGLIDNINDADIIANSDPDDRNGDGISGRVNLRENHNGTPPRLGRFGWKASQTDLHEQIALAFFQDMGITSSLHPPRQCIDTGCKTSPITSSELEISDKLLGAVVDYIANLAVPAAAHDELSQQGEAIFARLGCSACHTPAFTIRLPSNNFSSDEAQKYLNTEIAAETIYPYSDLLLHDMGDGLADQQPSDNTPANEWRTAPLWGLGIRTKNSHNTRLLHDGRAGSITEAILWHGGEADASKTSFSLLSHPEHTALLHFLKAL
jgi:CxxC motif-containing protein (DUF1111 family)